MNRSLIDHLVDQAILSRLSRRHEKVAVGVFLNPIQRLAGALGQFLVEALFQEQDFIGLDADVTGLALGTAQGLVNHDPRVLQAAALARSTSGEQESTHAGGQANTHGLHVGFDVLHGVEDAKAVVDRSAG